MSTETRDLWDEIETNKRKSLLLMFVCSLLLVGLGALIGQVFGRPISGVIFGFVIALFMSLIAFFNSDQIVLSASGAHEITHDDEPQLFNVVDEMRIASGLPMPKVYLIDDLSPNAFATGRDPEHASVAITRGLMTKLNREELQGVMAHEMSHVRNYDIRFAVILAVMVGSIALMSDFFLRFGLFAGFGGRRRSRSKGGGGAQAILLVLTILLAILAPIVAKLIELAASRRREYLADAGAVELTRNPLGLAKALEKISSDPDPLESANRATQHLYIVNPVKALDSGTSLFSTHPPIQERIQRLRDMAHAPAQGPQQMKGAQA